MTPPNPARTTANVWWIITAVSILAIFTPALTGLEGFNGGFAISFVAFFMVIVGLIVAVIYTWRASLLDSIFKGKDLLAHWTYPREEWLEYTEKEYERDKKGKWTLFGVISAIAVIIGIGFVLVKRDSASLWVLVSMFGLIAILAFTAWFTAWYNHRQNLKYNGEAFITPNAVYLNRQLHSWNSLGSWLDSVVLKVGSQPYLEFKYMAPTRTAVQEYSVNVPVPRGKEQEAKDLLEKFTTGKK